jgi:hypothetical protein
MSVNSHNHIKVGSSSKNSKVVGGFSFGVTGGDDYGPTTTSITGGTGTGFYNGITPPVGGYTIYSIVSGNIYANVANNDTEGMFYLQSLGATGTTISEMLAWAEASGNVIARPAEYTLSDLPGAAQATTGQTSILLTSVVGSPNWHYVVFDFTNNLITTPYDLGISYSDYSSRNIYYTNNKGYLVYFNYVSDYNNKHLYFISANGVLVETYGAEMYDSDINYGNNTSYVIDRTNSLFKYFDGFHVYTRDISTSNSPSFSAPYYYDDFGGYDGGVQTTWNDGTYEYVEYNYQGTVNLLNTRNMSNYNMDYFNYQLSNYTVLVESHSGSGQYYRIDIHDNITGTRLQRLPVDDLFFSYYDLYFYGNGKMIILLYNYGDTSVPYRMINYDGVIDRVITVDQPNDGNYTNRSSHYTTDYPNLNNGNPSESFFWDFYGNNNSYNNFMNVYGYFKTYSFYDGCTTPSVFTLTDTGNYDKAICNNYATSNHLYRLISTGLTTLEVLILGDSTETVIETGILLCDNSNNGMNAAQARIIGDNIYFESFSGNTVDFYNFTSYVVGKISGTTYDIKASHIFSSTNYDYWYGFDFIYVVDFDNSQAWYYNKSVTGFTETYFLGNNMSSADTEYFYRPPYFERRPTYIFYSQDTYEAYVLTKNSISPKVTLEPNNGIHVFQIGLSGLTYVYARASDGVIVIDVYDLSLTLKQRIVTNENSYNQSYIVNDRYIVVTNDNSGNFVYYRLTLTTYETITLPDGGYEDGPAPNDVVYGY